MLLSNWLHSLVASRLGSGIKTQSGKTHRRRTLKSGHQKSAQVDTLEPRLMMSAANVTITNISGATGFSVDGARNTASQFGSSVREAGDVNGDGFEDIVIGASNLALSGGPTAGGAYVLFGKSGGFTNLLDLHNLSSSDGFIVAGIGAGNYTGDAVSGAGDINGDGFDDLVIAAPYNTYGYDKAAAFVVFGKSSFGSGSNVTVNLSSINAAASDTVGFAVTGFNSVESYARDSVATGGDINGDGFDDLVVGAPTNTVDGLDNVGSANVIFGKASGFSNIDLSAANALDGTNGFVFTDSNRSAEGNSSAGARLGASVSIAGDLNGDGLDDLVVGAPNQHIERRNRYEGEAYVVFGQSSFASTPKIQVSDLTGSNGFVMSGPQGRHTRTGISVSSGGDVNGDGFDDLVVGGDNYSYDPSNPGVDDGGRAYVVFGGSNVGSSGSINLTSLSGSTGFDLPAGAEYDAAGRSVSITGDLNGDGFDDILIGAPTRYGTYDQPANYNGAAYVIFGRTTITPPATLDAVNGTNGFRLDGSGGVYAGRSVSFAGDVNGDGFDDLMISQPGTSDGRVTVFFGQDFGLNDGSAGNGELGNNRQLIDTTNNGNVLSATQVAGADALVGGRGNDTLNADGGSDVLIGGQGDDELVAVFSNFSAIPRFDGGTGVDTLTGNATFNSQTIDLTSVPGNRISNIEIIDIDDAATETLTLDLASVLAITGAGNTGASTSPFATNDAHTLTILLDENDTVNGIDGANGWTQVADQTIDGMLFSVFTQAGATVRIQSLVTADGDVNEDGNFDFTDGILIALVRGFFPSQTVEDNRGNNSTLTASQISANVTELVDANLLDVNEDGNQDFTDGILIALVKGFFPSQTVEDNRGNNSSLTAAQISTNVGLIPSPPAARPAPPAGIVEEADESEPPDVPEFVPPPPDVILVTSEDSTDVGGSNNQSSGDGTSDTSESAVNDGPFVTTEIAITMETLA